MPYQLVVIKGRSASTTLRIPPNAVTLVGRQNGCQIRIVSSLVSRRHCELTESDGKLIVRDLGSSNGTYVNGIKITEPTELGPGSALVIGSVVFRVEAAAPTGSADPTIAPSSSPADTAVPAEAAEIDFEIEVESESGSAVQTRNVAAPPAAEAEPVEPLGEDAVAEFLLGLDADEDKKR
ncbi:MAG: hypothetical protein KatS3mg108_2272 [Isosphaeraceae bacterium]|jgi:pSer/pThr/pTyr-binding forkhead associated (FHA) protein|nr:MAG: hypothetical protein KatS3mg108_2272 [Isosphaeraceae bacterium]